MAIAGTTPLREWINSKGDLVGDGNPLSRGAFTLDQSSPADGAYAVVARNSEGAGQAVAEDGLISRVRLQAIVYAGTQDAAENGAKALRAAFEGLSGCPEHCGATGVVVMVAENFIGPLMIQWGADTGEQYGFQVGADFLMYEA